jgi:hypothetical protein
MHLPTGALGAAGGAVQREQALGGTLLGGVGELLPRCPAVRLA